jgi:hypothetical protein
MLHVEIESSFPINTKCVGNDIPRIDGNLYLFAVSDEEYMFWHGLEPAERREFIDSMSGRCFHEVLVKLMRKKRPMNYVESSAVVGIDDGTKMV